MNEDKVIKILNSIENKLTNYDGRFDLLSRKLIDHDGQFYILAKKLNDHDAQFEILARKLLDHDGLFDILAKKLVDHDSQFDFLARKLLEHDERLDRVEETMATKQDLRGISNTLDILVKLAERKDHEVTVMGHQMSLMQNDIEKMKPLVGFAV